MLEALRGFKPIVDNILRSKRLSAYQDLASSYNDLADSLVGCADVLSDFFDGPQSVLVMAEDPQVRRNRLNLLGVLRNQAALLADFERISGG